MHKMITLVLYLNQNSSSLDLCLSQLAKLDSSKSHVLIYLDSKSPELCATIENFFSNKYSNFTLIKNYTQLGQAFCYNNAIDLAKTNYIMFMNFNSILADNFLVSIEDSLNNNYDVVSIESTNPSIFYNLLSSEYTEVNQELILGISNKEIFNKIYNVEFLKNNEIVFNDNKWYPDYFNLQVLLTFKMWKNILNTPLITFKKHKDVDFNLYDLLFQLKKMDNLINNSTLLPEFGFELEYWFVYIAKYKFLSKIDEKYPLEKNSSKLISLKNKEIRKLATKNVLKNLKLFCKNLNKNPYYKNFKKIIDTYSKSTTW